MRDIKFRAWDGDSKEMNHKVLVGNLDVDDKNYTAHCIFIDGGWKNFDEFSNVFLMQYTGLKDNNGVSIYEGDYVSLWYAPQSTARGFIKFENGGFYFKTKEAKPEICLAYDCVFEYGNSFTVIGNIHQNPELL